MPPEICHKWQVCRKDQHKLVSEYHRSMAKKFNNRPATLPMFLVNLCFYITQNVIILCFILSDAFMGWAAFVYLVDAVWFTRCTKESKIASLFNMNTYDYKI